MVPSEVDYILNNWTVDHEKAFEYKGYNLDIQYVVITKNNDNLYSVVYNKSTCNAGPFNKEAMEKLLGGNILIMFDGSGSTQRSYKYYKSGMCECGAWATRYPDGHANWCPKHRNNLW